MENDADDRAEEVFAGFLERVAKGEDVAFEAVLSAHPDLAARLLRLRDAEKRNEVIAAASRPAARPSIVGRYEILGELGEGGLGVVYRARDTALEREVALKLLLGGSAVGPERLARFRREVLLLSRLRHRNVVPVHDAGEHGGSPYFTMDVVPGGTLADALGESRLDRRPTLAVLAKVARGLQFAHEQGIVHRDIKPTNILLDSDDHPYLSDFGLALDLGSSEVVTTAGGVMGTPAYMAPEQASGARPEVDERTDIYSLGAVLYEVLTGRPPYAGEPVAVLRAIAEGPPAPPRRVDARLPRALNRVCLKAMAREKRDRYASAAAFADDLERYLRGEAVLAGAGEEWRRLSNDLLRVARRNRVALALAAALLGGGIALLWSSERSRARDRERVRAGVQSEARQTLAAAPQAAKGGEWEQCVIDAWSALVLAPFPSDLVPDALCVAELALRDDFAPIASRIAAWVLAHAPDGEARARAARLLGGARLLLHDFEGAREAWILSAREAPPGSPIDIRARRLLELSETFGGGFRWIPPRQLLETGLSREVATLASTARSRDGASAPYGIRANANGGCEAFRLEIPVRAPLVVSRWTLPVRSNVPIAPGSTRHFLLVAEERESGTRAYFGVPEAGDRYVVGTCVLGSDPSPAATRIALPIGLTPDTRPVVADLDRDGADDLVAIVGENGRRLFVVDRMDAPEPRIRAFELRAPAWKWEGVSPNAPESDDHAEDLACLASATGGELLVGTRGNGFLGALRVSMDGDRLHNAGVVRSGAIGGVACTDPAATRPSPCLVGGRWTAFVPYLARLPRYAECVALRRPGGVFGFPDGLDGVSTGPPTQPGSEVRVVDDVVIPTVAGGRTGWTLAGSTLARRDADPSPTGTDAVILPLSNGAPVEAAWFPIDLRGRLVAAEIDGDPAPEVLADWDGGLLVLGDGRSDLAWEKPLRYPSDWERPITEAVSEVERSAASEQRGRWIEAADRRSSWLKRLEGIDLLLSWASRDSADPKPGPPPEILRDVLSSMPIENPEELLARLGMPASGPSPRPGSTRSLVTDFSSREETESHFGSGNARWRWSPGSSHSIADPRQAEKGSPSGEVELLGDGIRGEGGERTEGEAFEALDAWWNGTDPVDLRFEILLVSLPYGAMFEFGFRSRDAGSGEEGDVRLSFGHPRNPLTGSGDPRLLSPTTARLKRALLVGRRRLDAFVLHEWMEVSLAIEPRVGRGAVTVRRLGRDESDELLFRGRILNIPTMAQEDRRFFARLEASRDGARGPESPRAFLDSLSIR